MSELGYCPQCGAACFARERRLNGNDICERGHKYPSHKALKEPSNLGCWKNKLNKTLVEVKADYRGFIMFGIVSRPQDQPSTLHKEEFLDLYERF
jgi:hypothetical protein